MWKYIFEELAKNVVLSFEAKKELNISSCQNNNFDNAENVNE